MVVRHDDSGWPPACADLTGRRADGAPLVTCVAAMELLFSPPELQVCRVKQHITALIDNFKHVRRKAPAEKRQ